MGILWSPFWSTGAFGPLSGLWGFWFCFWSAGAVCLLFGLLGLFWSFCYAHVFIYRYPVKRVPVDEKHEHNHNMAIYIGLPVHGCNPMKKTIDKTQVNVTLRAKRQTNIIINILLLSGYICYSFIK